MNLFKFFKRGAAPRRSKSDKKIAEQRLRLVLAHDRANISPGMLEILKDEIIEVISRHLEITPEAVTVNFTEDNYETRLVADIPIASRKRHPDDEN
ncbi:MAG: cell division topological specificity factor MinE [Anaerolineae bacterium]|nr:cell division topological specificity factor MinE [Anaerolineae bacterium]